jgi:predicted ABC-type ATPase
VRYRTQIGGHGVPEEKIAARYSRSLKNFDWFAERSDIVFLIDNSRDGRSLLAAEKPLSGRWRTYDELDVAPLLFQSSIRRLIAAKQAAP